MTFNVNYNENNNLIASLSGDLDINVVDDFRDDILNRIDGSKDIILDLKDLDYIDSTGLGVVMTAYKEATEKGKTLKVKNAKRNIYKLFKITELDELLGMEE